MNYMKQNNTSGWFFIILGVVLLIAVVGHLLVRVFIGFIAFVFINYGLQLRGMLPLPILIRKWLSMAGWYNF